MGDTAIIAFNNLELIFLLIGLTIRSNIYDLVLSPMAMSFVTLLVVFKIVMFVIESAELKMQNSDLISGQFYLKLLFFICIARLLLRKTDLHIKTIKSVVNEETLDRTEKVNTFVPKDSEYSVESSGLFSFDKTGVEMFGDSWFSINQPHSEILEGTPLMDSKFTDGGVYTVKLPIFVVFPIVLIDGLLYGSDGVPGSGSTGIIPRIFGKYYAYLIHDPGRVFHLVYDNSKLSIESQRGDMYGGYTAYRTSMMDAIHFINKSAEDIIQIYNNFPLYMYLDIRTGEKDRVKKDWRYNETSTQMKEIFTILNQYNKALTKKLTDNIRRNSADYLAKFSTFAEDYSGSSKAIPPVYPNNDYDISDNKKEDRYPTWKKTGTDSLLSSEYYMAGKMTILQIAEPVNPVSDEEKYISELRNAYTNITKQNIPLNKRDNPYDDVILNRGFYKKSEVDSLGIPNYYIDYTIAFNLYEEFASSKLHISNPLVGGNPFDMLVQDFRYIEQNIYNPSSHSLLPIPSFASEAMLKQKEEARKYNPNGSSIEKSIKLKKHYLDYQKEAYFKYYFIEPINFNRGQYYANLESSSSYTDKAPSLYFLWNSYKDFYNDISTIFPKTQRINTMPIFKKLTDPVSSGGGGMIESKPQKYIMKVQDQASIKNDAVIEEFRNKHYANTRAIAEKMINLKINNLWATKTKNLGQDEIPQDKSDSEVGVFNQERDLKLDLPIIGEIGGVIVKFILDLFGVIIYWVLNGIFLLLTHLFRILYSLIYSLHSLGLLITLVTFPLIFIKAMMSQSFSGLIKPFLNYLSYRMWDFALLLVIMIVLMITPVILKFFFAFPSFLRVMLEILYIIGIFILTSTFIDMITKIVGGESAFGGMFNTVGSGVGKTVATRGIAAGATASGAAALMAARGGSNLFSGAGGGAMSNLSGAIGNSFAGKGRKKMFGVAKESPIGQGLGNISQSIGNSAFGKGLGGAVSGLGGVATGVGITASSIGKTIKESSIGKGAVSGAKKVGNFASAVGDKSSSFGGFAMKRVRDVSRFQNRGGISGVLFNKGEPLKQFDNSTEKTVKEGVKNFVKGEGLKTKSSQSYTNEELTVGNETSLGSKSNLSNAKKAGTSGAVNNDFNEATNLAQPNFSTAVGNSSNVENKLKPREEVIIPKTKDGVEVSQISGGNKSTELSKSLGNSLNSKTNIDSINANSVNANQLKSDGNNSQKDKMEEKEKPVQNNISKRFSEIKDSAKKTGADVLNGVMQTNVVDGTSSKKDNNDKPSSSSLVKQQLKETVKQTLKETQNGLQNSRGSKEEKDSINKVIDSLGDKLEKALSGKDFKNMSSKEIQSEIKNNTEIQKVIKTQENPTVINTIIERFSDNLSNKK